MRCQTDKTHPPNEPSFLPLPAKPANSSTPANNPGLPLISPKYRSTPSNPSDSNLTLSPTSNDLPALLALLVKTSEARLDGRGIVFLDVVPLRDTLELRAEDEDALDGGRPETDLLPDNVALCVVGGERETSLE